MSALVDGRGLRQARVAQGADAQNADTHGADTRVADTRVADSLVAPAHARTFHTLDALRGVAAGAVLLFHASFMYAIGKPAEGQIAVDLFFVISGFIIAYRYDRDFARGMSFPAFVRIRLVRLYPLFVLGLVLGVMPPLAALATGAVDPLGRAMVSSFGLGLFMLPSTLALPKIAEVYPLNYVSWSLALEIAINVAYAASFRFWTIRRIACFVLLAFLSLCACVIHYGTLNIGYDWANAPGGVARIAFAFPMGVLLFRLQDRKPFAFQPPWWALLCVALGILFFDAPVAKPLWELFAVTVLVPLIVAGAIGPEPPKILQPACALVGLLSYALYSLHAPFIGLFLRAETHLHLDVTARSPVESLVFTVTLMALCATAHLAYDRPVRRWLGLRMTSGRRDASGKPRVATKY